jgi:hypothetical protein
MTKGAEDIRGQAGMEKSTDCCHFAYKMKKMKDEGVKETGEEPTVIYLTCLPNPPVTNLLEGL